MSQNFIMNLINCVMYKEKFYSDISIILFLLRIQNLNNLQHLNNFTQTISLLRSSRKTLILVKLVHCK